MKIIICAYSFLNYAASFVVICKSASKNHALFLTVITQVTTFSLNVGTSNKNFKANKFSRERSF